MRQGRFNRFRQTGVLKRIPSGSDPTARTTVLPSLACSHVYDMDAKERERAGLATVEKAKMVYTAVPSGGAGIIHIRDRFVVNSVDYRIDGMQKWPEDNPGYLALFLVDDQ